MPRLARDGRLETREARTKLRISHEPYWRLIEKGFYLGYRKGKRGKAGTWIARRLIDGKYKKKSLGKADDFGEDNKVDVLSFKHAQEKAREWVDKEARKEAGVHEGPYYVKDAINDYLDWYQVHRKSYDRVKSVCDNHILGALGEKNIETLQSRQIRQWHENLTKKPPLLKTAKGKEQNYREKFDPRARKVTANRALTILKSALNRAWMDGMVPSDNAWRKVKPFKGVEDPKIAFLNEKECQRLVNACPEHFRQLVQGALYTGCRYGELIKMKCEDFNPKAGIATVYDTKSGRTRHIPVTAVGNEFFKRQKAGRKGSDWMFKREDGEPWGRSHQIRIIKKASGIAKIDPAATFHTLRHTYGSALAQNGVPLQVIAEALGHADTRITSRHYAHLMPSYVADTIRANLPDFGKFEGDNVVGMDN
jgi:integrase